MTESQNVHRNLGEITVESVRDKYVGSHIGYDMVMVDSFMNMVKPGHPLKMQCLLLALCLRGECRYTVDTVEHVAYPNDIVIIGKGQTILSGSESNDYESIGLVMSYDFFDELVKGVHGLSSLFLFAKHHPVYRLTREEADCIRWYYSMIRQKVDNHAHRFRKETVQSLIATMIYDISNAMYRVRASEKLRTRAEQIFMDFITLVEQNFCRERRVGWYGQQLCLSPKYLSETVKSISHRTPSEWIDYYVMLELRVLLRNTACSVKEIAQRMNFSSQSFLGKYFKEHTGMGPMEYRMEKGRF